MFHGSQHCFNFFQTFINFSSHFDIFNWDRLSAIKVNQVCVKNKFYEWPSHKVNCESNPSKPTFSRKISFLIDWRSLNWPVLWILIIEKSCLFAFRITNIAEKKTHQLRVKIDFCLCKGLTIIWNCDVFCWYLCIT